MATARRRSKKKTAAPKRRRRARKTASPKRHRRARAVAAPKRRRRRAKKAVAVTRRRRRRTVRVEAKRSRRRRAAATATPRRRKRRHVKAWKGDSAGHAKASKKGHRRRRAARKTTKRRRRRSKTRETTYAAAPRRRRRRSSRRHVMEASRPRRRRHRMHASRGGSMGIGGMALAVGSAGFGFVLADGLDRLLATYDPTGATKPKDKFTSDGTGMLANTLNVGAMPNWKRVVAGVGVVAVPAVGSMFVKNEYGKVALEGLALGAGVSAFKSIWNNILMPMLIGKDTSPATLQKSYIARLYPTEVSASLNKKQAMTAVSSSGSGALSDGPAAGASNTGVGAPDVGPFALGGDSPYPDAAQALRGDVRGDSPYPTADQALRTGVHGDSPYPTASQAQAGVSAPTPTGANDPNWNPGPPAGPGPGPQAKPHADCGCIGENDMYLGFVGEAERDDVMFDTGTAA